MNSKNTNKAFTLRPYQREAIGAIIQARKAGLKRLVVSLPTGAGKTVIFSELARMAKRGVLVLAHRDELVKQARDKIARTLGDRKAVDIEQGPRRSDGSAKVTVCSIRSLSQRRLKRLLKDRDPGLIIYDECHHSVSEDNKRVLRQLGAFEPDWTGTLVGFTATTMRADGLALNTVFEDIVYSLSIQDMIRDSYLAPLKGFRVATAADLKSVGAGGQDFVVEELAEAIDIKERNALVARSIQELARDRRTIAFCVTVAHARNLCRSLNKIGVRAGIVHGKLKAEARAQVLEEFRTNKIQVVTNVAVLTEGFDDPGVSCIAMARPTRSEGLYTQCVGRGTRLFEGKKDCLILDFVDLSDLSLVSLPSLFGMPRDLNLQGQDVDEAAQQYQQWMLDYPGFEVPPGEVTLADIKRRAEGFNPLTLEVQHDVLAISGNAWCSLGRRGLVLHFYKKPRKLSVFVVKNTGLRGRKRYQVFLDGKKKAQFSNIEEAVEAVDYEVQRLGPQARRTALEHAPWRKQSVPPDLQRRLKQLQPPRFAGTIGEAYHLLAFEQALDVPVKT